MNIPISSFRIRIHPAAIQVSLLEPLRDIVRPKTLKMLWLHYICVSFVFSAGLYHLFISVASLYTPYVFRKDFIQEYVLARATISGLQPYQSVALLAQRFIDNIPVPLFQHPTPHPPPVALLSLPLGFFSYGQAACIWYLFEIVCIFWSVFILLGKCRHYGLGLSLILPTLALFAWNPVFEELILGQLMSLLILLLILAWHSFRHDRLVLCGFLLGLVISLKLICWPILFYFTLRNKWRVVTSGLITIMATNGIAALIMGHSSIVLYYQTVGLKVASLYKTCASNISPYAMAWRLFKGTGCSVLSGTEAPAILFSPWLAQILSVILPASILALGLYAALKMRDFDHSFALMVCISLMTNPLLWVHYFILLILPLYIMFHGLYKLNFPFKNHFFF